MTFADTHGYEGPVRLQRRLLDNAARLSSDYRHQRAWGTEMAKKGVTLRRWTNEEVLVLTTLARAQTKTMVIARKLRRSYAATRKKASTLGVILGGGRGGRGRKGA
jgi:hypothetical protein